MSKNKNLDTDIEVIDYIKDKKYKNVLRGASDILNLVRENQIVSVSAPEKSGKRSLVQAQSQKDSNYDHYLISSLNRKDWQPQIEEFKEAYGVECIIANSARKDQLEAQSQFKRIITSKRPKLIHLDEGDWGTSLGGPMAAFWAAIIKNSNNRICIYSATNEEARFALNEYFSNYKYGTADYFYDPGPTFRWAPWYLKNSSQEAEAFVATQKNGNVIITPHGVDFLNENLLNTNCRFVVVRLTIKGQYSAAKNSIEFNRTLRKMGVQPLYRDQNEPFNWYFQHKGKRGDWSSFVDGKYVIFINQICGRSTEVGFLPEIGAWHDFRNITPSKTHNTLRQALGRVYHFTGQYDTKDRLLAFANKLPNVKLYCHLPVLEAASQKSVTEGIKASNRITTNREEIKDILWITISEEIQTYIKNKAREGRRANGRTGYGQRSVFENNKHNIIDRSMHGREDYGYEFIYIDKPNPDPAKTKSWKIFINKHLKWVDIKTVEDYDLIKKPNDFLAKFSNSIKSVPGWRLQNKRVVFLELDSNLQVTYHTKDNSMYHR